jgi:dolichyl-phosphate beta-glucosyltransferase
MSEEVAAESNTAFSSVRTIIVVPCYNEVDRWQFEYWKKINEAGITLLFVDDGSNDGTWETISADVPRLGALSLQLPVNVGKAEAVRKGFEFALSQDAEVVGYLDADAAFPAEVVVRISELSKGLLDENSWDSVWAARILLGGRDVVRKTSRHYFGRLVATLIAPSHGHAVYDTQTGFKLFRNCEPLNACLEQPFETRWFVDVELLMRWRSATGRLMRVWEEPVEGWRDIGGSKVNSGQYMQLARDIVTVKRYPSRG